jgi:hypothetical protein
MTALATRPEPMTRERLAGLVERYRLAADLDDGSALGLAEFGELLTEVYRVRAVERAVIALVTRTRAMIGRRVLDYEELRVRVEAEIAQAAAEDCQEEPI